MNSAFAWLVSGWIQDSKRRQADCEKVDNRFGLNLVARGREVYLEPVSAAAGTSPDAAAAEIAKPVSPNKFDGVFQPKLAKAANELRPKHVNYGEAST
ncbi:MAG: hypothetical protein AAF585_25065 [Verrucomicrobiota bacterium]